MFDLQGTDDARGMAISAHCLLSVGRIAKVHGIRGGVVLVWHDSPPVVLPSLKAGNFLFVMLDGLPVPHRVSEVWDREDGSALLHFSRIDSPETARALCGCDVQALRNGLEAGAAEGVWTAELEMDLAGCDLLNQDGALVGQICGVEAYSLNVVLLVKTATGQERMVPFHPSLVLRAPSCAGDSLQLIIPEGLEDL